VLRSQELLANHPLNIERQKRGMDAANCIWPWGGGYRPKMTPLTETYPQIRKGAVITAVDLIRGIGRYAGLDVINVPGATGLWDTDFRAKAEAAIEALRTNDFVYLHVEASDEAGHDGDLHMKLGCIEHIDHLLLAPILEQCSSLRSGAGGAKVDGQWSIALLPDHPTPIRLRTHTAEPVPFCIYHLGIEPDGVQTFDEIAAQEGIYGTIEGDAFIKEFMKTPPHS
jgi:2,3-bisphosphoglycerate-independent phosphoglycerate mutase